MNRRTFTLVAQIPTNISLPFQDNDNKYHTFHQVFANARGTSLNRKATKSFDSTGARGSHGSFIPSFTITWFASVRYLCILTIPSDGFDVMMKKNLWLTNATRSSIR